jgi:hypothetical protein
MAHNLDNTDLPVLSLRKYGYSSKIEDDQVREAILLRAATEYGKACISQRLMNVGRLQSKQSPMISRLFFKDAYTLKPKTDKTKTKTNTKTSTKTQTQTMVKKSRRVVTDDDDDDEEEEDCQPSRRRRI